MELCNCLCPQRLFRGLLKGITLLALEQDVISELLRYVRAN